MMTKVRVDPAEYRDRLNDPPVKVRMHLSYEDIMGQRNPVVEAPDVFAPLVGDGTRRKAAKRADQNELHV